jgi:hypothetical protein
MAALKKLKGYSSAPFFALYKQIYEYEALRPDLKFEGSKAFKKMLELTLEKGTSESEVNLGVLTAETVINKRHGIHGISGTKKTATRKKSK